MKKILLIFLMLIACNVDAQVVTFSTPIAADSGVIYMGKDSTAWDQDRLKMTQIFKDDGTIFGAVPTLSEIGDLFVKIFYWPVGSSDSETIGSVYKTPSILDTAGYASVTVFLDSLFQTRLPSDTGDGAFLSQLLNDIDKIRDSVQYLITATGFSTHSAADKWTTGGRELSTPANYKADVSALATSAALATVDAIVDLILTYTDGDGNDGIDANIDLIRDSLQYLVTATSLSSLGFDLDSADFTNETFPTWLFTTEFFNSAQGTAAGLAATDIWNVLFNTVFADGTMGDSLTNASYVQGGAANVDSAMISRLLHRIVWGTTKATGSDSSTLAERDVTVASFIAALDSANFELEAFRGPHFSDSYWDSLANRSDSGATGTDTAQILAMMNDENFARNTDSLLLANRMELAAEFGDSVWSKLLNGYTAIPGSAADVLLDSLDALVSTAGGVASISNSDKGDIADSVFFKLVTDTGNASFFGALYRAVLGCSSGNGAFTINYYVIDSSNGGTDPVQQAPVWANNYAQTAVPYFDLTDNNGLAQFNLDAASWVFFHTAAGLAPYLDSNVVSGVFTDTIWTYTSNANKAVVYGTLIDPRGQRYDSALVMFRLVAVPEDSLLTFHDSLVMQEITYDTADVNGQFEIPIYANENLSDTSYYRVRFQDKLGNYIDKYAWNVWVNDTSQVAFDALGRWRD